MEIAVMQRSRAQGIDWGQSRFVKEGDKGRGEFAHMKKHGNPSKLGKTNKEVTRTKNYLEARVPIEKNQRK